LPEVKLVAILAQYGRGIKMPDLCREHGISRATRHQWQQPV